MNLVWVTAQDAPALAAAHAQAFENPWDAQAFTDLLAGPGVYGALASDEAPLGLILCRVVAGEMEVLTVGVTPQARRRGVGNALMATALAAARQAGATEAFLEVAADNPAAIGLYAGLGFCQAGVRRGYYQRNAGSGVDALVLRLDLTQTPS